MGAGLATSLVNTAPEVRSAGEVLVDPAALEHFLEEHEIRPDALADGRPTAADLDQVRALRQEIRAVIEAADEDRLAEGAAALVARAATGPSLHRDDEGRWQWHVATAPRASLADELAVLVGTGLLGALRALGHDRFRDCASPVCNGVFVDTSRAGRRRYCMPELCGNRLNVANHRARRQAAKP
ncbi:CGNR zinc finger domain-containing protein [Saccharopolyspora sp. NPDC050389]|uniref:CGNR zinc finger domain-containing protein n=1 Tax=Saccharopolyspora sp. NPDC050389 TaxID=3155516 RepID=UPI0033F9D407